MGYKYTSSSQLLDTSSVSSTPPVIENSTPRNHHHIPTPSSPRLFRLGGWEVLHLSPPLYSGWFAHLLKYFSPWVCVVELCLLIVFSSLTPLSLASCFAKRATVANPFSSNSRRLGTQFAVREYISLTSLPSHLRIGFLSSTGHGRIRHSPPLLSAWWWYPTH